MLKKLASLAAAGIMALSIASTAHAASGFSYRDPDSGKTYTQVQLNSGRTIRLFPTPQSCGGRGKPYDFMGEMFNSGGHAYVEAECGNLVRVCVRNGIEMCSTYSRVPVMTYRVYDDGF